MLFGYVLAAMLIILGCGILISAIVEDYKSRHKNEGDKKTK